MTTYSAWRSARPGLWLGAALAAELAVYATAARDASVMPWLLLDLWLVFRIWKRGATSLAIFRFLQALGVTLFGLVLVLARWDHHVETAATPGTVALFAVSTWCLLAPALSLHVAEGRRMRAATAQDERSLHTV
jgi:hypothetical protein